jgi:prefoldin alpha subunit
MKEKEEKMQKLYLEFQVLDQQIKQLEKQSIALNNQLMELMMTNQSLDDMKNTKEGTEILTPLSSGIYAKAELKDNKSFIVNVGANTALVKDVNSTKKLIETQIDEIKNLQKNLVSQLQTRTTKAALLEQEINKIASEVQNK